MSAVAKQTRSPTFPTTLTASKWETVWQSAWDRVLSARRAAGIAATASASDGAGTIGPRLTNGEALALVAAWRDAAPSKFPLWYQYAALAYGWDPATNDNLDTSPARAARAFLPDDVNVSLWVQTHDIAADLDNANVQNPRLDLDTAFGDVVFSAKVRAELQADGAQASWKIPTGLCIDKKTGKRRPATRPKCGPDGKYRDPITGVEMPCSTPGDCTPELLDDPITKIGKDVFTLALIVGAVWWLARNNKPRRRRRT